MVRASCFAHKFSLQTRKVALIESPAFRGAAAELPQVPLDDALRVCLPLRDKEPESYERAAVRWIARFALSGRRNVEDLRVAAEAFEANSAGPSAHLERRLDGMGRCYSAPFARHILHDLEKLLAVARLA